VTAGILHTNSIRIRPMSSHRSVLDAIARRAMVEHGVEPEFSNAALAEARQLSQTTHPDVRDLRTLPWSSIDNAESRDLDQLEVCGESRDGVDRLMVAIADVDALVPRQSAIDGHAQQNTTSVYTAARIFPMLPESLSTDRTSLNPESDRAAIVVEMAIDRNGVVRSCDIYQALVRNHAKLAYDAVAGWLEGTAAAPAALEQSGELAAQVRRQDEEGHCPGDFVGRGGQRAANPYAPCLRRRHSSIKRTMRAVVDSGYARLHGRDRTSATERAN